MARRTATAGQLATVSTAATVTPIPHAPTGVATGVNETVEQMVARLKAENAALAAAIAARSQAPKLTFKVSEKGGASIYGLGRFPVTLYIEQWDRLDAQYAEFRKFLDKNRSKFSKKA